MPGSGSGPRLPGQGRPWAHILVKACARRGLGLEDPPRPLAASGPGHGPAKPEQGDLVALAPQPAGRGLLVRAVGLVMPLRPPLGRSLSPVLGPRVLGAQQAAGPHRRPVLAQLQPPLLLMQHQRPAWTGPGPSGSGAGRGRPSLAHQAAGGPQAALDLWCGPTDGPEVAQNRAQRVLWAWVRTGPRRAGTDGGACHPEGHPAHPRQGAGLPESSVQTPGLADQRPGPPAPSCLRSAGRQSWAPSPRSPCRLRLFPTHRPLLPATGSSPPTCLPHITITLTLTTTDAVPGTEPRPTSSLAAFRTREL